MSFSVYIPYVFTNFDKTYVTNVFKKYGDVRDVDFVNKTDKRGKSYNSVFVHFNTCSEKFENDVKTQKDFKITHDGRWFWIVLPKIYKPVTMDYEKLLCEKLLTAWNSKDINVPPEDEDNEVEKIFAQMDEMENEIDAEESNLISIDWRYVQAIEQENINLRMEIYKLHNALNSNLI